MEEKYMVNDILYGLKTQLLIYQTIIFETENIRLRQEFQKIRNEIEAFQYELLKIAKVKGYYKEKEIANIEQIKQVKNEFQN